VNFDQEWKPSPKKTAGYRNGKFESLKIKVSDDLKLFWDELLIPQLQNRHNAKPTHTLSEIQLLQSKFPSQILQYYVESEGEKIAGITLFDFGKILKVQYAAANPIGFDKNAMDFLYLEIIQEARDQGRQFVDLGTVNNRDGSINEGLLHFKKQLGAVVTPVYEIALDLRS
jgi:lipid II:glycine glycyltransferase (peptidoglycan interpeptide bridge formation enzyme)